MSHLLSRCRRLFTSNRSLPQPKYLGWGKGISNPLHSLDSELQEAIERKSPLISSSGRWPDCECMPPDGRFRLSVYVYAGGLRNVGLKIDDHGTWRSVDRERRGEWWREVRLWLREVCRENEVARSRTEREWQRQYEEKRDDANKQHTAMIRMWRRSTSGKAAKP